MSDIYDVGIYGQYPGLNAKALVSRLMDAGKHPVICFAKADLAWEKDIQAISAGRAINFVKNFSQLRACLPEGARIFVFSRYDSFAEEASTYLPMLRKGDVILEANAFPFRQSETIQEAFTAREISWIPLKMTSGVQADASSISILAAMGASDTVTRELLESLVKRRLDNRPCLALVREARLVAAARSGYRGLLDTVLQGIAEAAYILSNLFKLSPFETRMILSDWGKTELDSPVLEAARNILGSMDENGEAVLSRITDKVKLDRSDIDTIRVSYEFGTVQPLAQAAFSARLISGMKEERLGASVNFNGSKKNGAEPKEFIALVRDAYIASFAIAYAQSLNFLRAAISPEELPDSARATAPIALRSAKNSESNAEIADIALAWAGASLLQGPLLDLAATSLEQAPNLSGLLLAPSYQSILNRCQEGLRKTVAKLAEAGIPAPVLSSALSLYDSFRSEQLSANLVAAGLDYFFGVGYERVDNPNGERYHLDWLGSGTQTKLDSKN